jgi:hypothetical protein
MSVGQDTSVFVQRLSVWKTLAGEAFLVAGAVIPLIPHFSDGLVYTAFLFQMPFFIFLVCGCVICGLGAIFFLLLIWRAVRRVPVLTITHTTITALLATHSRSVEKSDIVSVDSIWPGANVNLRMRNARPLGLPVWFYEKPALVREQLAGLGRTTSPVAQPSS